MSKWVLVSTGEQPKAEYYLNLDTDEFKRVESTKTSCWAKVSIYREKGMWVEVSNIGVSPAKIPTPKDKTMLKRLVYRWHDKQGLFCVPCAVNKLHIKRFYLKDVK